MILCIDTAIEQCSAGISWEGELVDSVTSESSMRASEILHSMIHELMEKNGLELNDLKAVAVNGGPGSYTGLRIGASSAKGLCYALNIPLIHVGSLELLTEGIIERQDINDFDYYVPMIDARRDEVFTGIFDVSRKVILPPQPMILNQNSFNNITQYKSVFFGNGAEKVERILNNTENFTFLNSGIKAEDFTRLVWNKWIGANFEDVVNYTPSYLKKFHLTSPKSS